MREIVTVQVGQCGNQVGSEFWNRLCAEHGIAPDGSPPANPAQDRKDVFFAQADCGKFVPRAVLVDMEPGVLHAIKNSPQGKLFSSSGFWVHPEGAGAGNNWAKGFAAGESSLVLDQVMDIVSREAEACDFLEGFMFTHSIAGGTGSGLGSRLLQELRDRYPKLLLQTYSVFPNQKASSDVVVQPYNSMLTLRRLCQCVDAVVVIDNRALDRLVQERFKVPQPTFVETNSIVSRIMSASTATLRFPSHTRSDLHELVMMLTPEKDCHFLSSSFAPLYFPQPGEAPPSIRTSVPDIQRNLLQAYNWLVSCDPNDGRYMALANILQGDVGMLELRRSVEQNWERLRFVEWDMPKYFKTSIANSSPYLPRYCKVNGFMLANHTSVRKMLFEISGQFSKLWSRKAFFQQFAESLGQNEAQMEFEESKAAVEHIAHLYQNYS